MNESNAYLILAIMAVIYLLGFLLIPRVTNNERKLQDAIDEHGALYEEAMEIAYEELRKEEEKNADYKQTKTGD